MFVGTSNGFNVFNRKQKIFKRFFKKKRSSLISNNILSLARVDEKNILVATDGGINVFNTENESFLKDFVIPEFNVKSLSLGIIHI